MSGALSSFGLNRFPASPALQTGVNLLNAIASWRNSLQPASFRGVPFEVNAMEGGGGRRLVVSEFPGREIPYVEDLGRQAQRHNIRAFVIGDDYIGQRDDLLQALQDNATAGLLVHPTMGQIMARCLAVRWVESKDLGGYCALDIEFVQDGPLPSPLLGTDTASGLLRSVLAFARVAQSVYRLVSLIATDPLYVLSLQGGWLGLAGNALRALSVGTISGQSANIAALSAAPANDDATIAAVSTVFDGCATNVIAGRLASVASADPVDGVVVPAPLDADPSGGLLGLATWGSDLVPETGSTAAAIAQRQQLAATQALIRSHALIAVVQIYASIDWPYVQAAAAARSRLMTVFDAQSQAAADAGHDDLYRALQSLQGLIAQDMIARAQRLPRLDAYTLGASLPSDVLSWRLYGDATHAAELEDLNAVEHPLFMPPAGSRLVA